MATLKEVLTDELYYRSDNYAKFLAICLDHKFHCTIQHDDCVYFNPFGGRLIRLNMLNGELCRQTTYGGEKFERILSTHIGLDPEKYFK